MKSRPFVRGFQDYKQGKKPDEAFMDHSYSYERGRHFSVIFPLSLKHELAHPCLVKAFKEKILI